MLRITVDTDALPIDSILQEMGDLEAEVAVTSVTAREVAGYKGKREIRVLQIPVIPETGVWAESQWGQAIWAERKEADRFENILRILSDGSFPKPGCRSTLTKGQKHQLRDAMILEAHVREGRDVFISGDFKAFGEDGSKKRHRLLTLLGTKIMSRNEFSTFCAAAGQKPAR